MMPLHHPHHRQRTTLLMAASSSSNNKLYNNNRRQRLRQELVEGSYKVWREIAPTGGHYVDYMNTSRGGSQRDAPKDNLQTKWIYHIRAPVTGEGHRGGGSGRSRNQKILTFTNLDQVHMFKAYLSKPPFGSTAWPTMNTGWYNSWYEKLPKGLTKTKNRLKTLKLLSELLQQFETRTPQQIEDSLSSPLSTQQQFSYYDPTTQTWYWERKQRQKNERNNKRNTYWMKQRNYR